MDETIIRGGSCDNCKFGPVDVTRFEVNSIDEKNMWPSGRFLCRACATTIISNVGNVLGSYSVDAGTIATCLGGAVNVLLKAQVDCIAVACAINTAGRWRDEGKVVHPTDLQNLVQIYKVDAEMLLRSLER